MRSSVLTSSPPFTIHLYVLHGTQKFLPAVDLLYRSLVYDTPCTLQIGCIVGDTSVAAYTAVSTLSYLETISRCPDPKSDRDMQYVCCLPGFATL